VEQHDSWARTAHTVKTASLSDWQQHGENLIRTGGQVCVRCTGPAALPVSQFSEILSESTFQHSDWPESLNDRLVTVT
jgi:hypothetical protein